MCMHKYKQRSAGHHNPPPRQRDGNFSGCNLSWIHTFCFTHLAQFFMYTTDINVNYGHKSAIFELHQAFSSESRNKWQAQMGKTKVFTIRITPKTNQQMSRVFPLNQTWNKSISS